MGNRAVITTLENEKGIYIHWNGGRDSVEPILWYCKNLMPKTQFAKTELERIAFVMDLLGLNPEIDEMRKLDCDNYDNGVYITDGYKIIARAYMHGKEQDAYNFTEFVMHINENMPKQWQRNEDYILKTMSAEFPEYSYGGKTDATEFHARQNIGDEVLYEGEFVKIIGRNESDEYINGSVRNGQLFFNYTSRYEDGSRFKISDAETEVLRKNPNSYFHGRDGVLDVKIVNQGRYQILKNNWESKKGAQAK